MKIKITPPEQRVCKICGDEKPVTQFRGTQKVCNPCDNNRKCERTRKKKEESKLYFGY